MKAPLLSPLPLGRTLPVDLAARSAAATPERNLVTKLLVPYDFSPTSQKALDYALALARRSGKASLHLAHIVAPLPFCFMEDVVPVALPDQEAASQLEHRLAALAREHCAPGWPISSAVHLGQPAEEIVALAK